MRAAMASAGVATSVHYPSLARHPLFGNEQQDGCCGDEDKRIITLPTFAGLTADDQRRVVDALAFALDGVRKWAPSASAGPHQHDAGVSRSRTRRCGAGVGAVRQRLADRTVPHLQAAACAAHGAVLRSNVPFGPDAGPCITLVGSVASRNRTPFQARGIQQRTGLAPRARRRLRSGGPQHRRSAARPATPHLVAGLRGRDTALG